MDKRKKKFLILAALLFVAFIVLTLSVRQDLGTPVTLACTIYALMVTGVFAVQLWGFVISQTDYSESVEEAKYKIISEEENEWKVLEKKAGPSPV